MRAHVHTCTHTQTAPPPFVKDWYGLYKKRVGMTSPTKVMVVDFGSFSCKCAVINRVKSSIRTSTTESVVALVRGGRRGGGGEGGGRETSEDGETGVCRRE